MSTSTHEFDWNALLESAGPYPREAFEFVQMGLSHTQERRFEESVGLPEDERHVSRVIRDIWQRTGFDVLNLPMLAEYHIDLGFPLQWP